MMTSPDNSSPTAFPPDDVLREILLRLPPHSCCLLRASFVSKHWRALVADPDFLRQHRARHGGRALILGVFHNNPRAGGRFIGAGNDLDPPDRVFAERFSPPDLRCDRWLVLSGGGRWLVLGCHGGRALLHNCKGRLLVWDPLTDDRRYVQLPRRDHDGAEWDPTRGRTINAVLMPPDAAADHLGFRIALACVGQGFAVGVVYSSDTGSWGNHATAMAGTSIPSEKPGVAVGDGVYWLLNDNSVLSLKLLDGGRQVDLSVLPPEVPKIYAENVQLMRTADGEVGLAAVTASALHLLALEGAETDGNRYDMSWALRKTIQLDGELMPAWPIESSSEQMRPSTVRIISACMKTGRWCSWGPCVACSWFGWSSSQSRRCRNCAAPTRRTANSMLSIPVPTPFLKDRYVLCLRGTCDTCPFDYHEPLLLMNAVWEHDLL